MFGGVSGREQASRTDCEAATESQARETWSRVKRRLRAELGEDVFASWFARLELDDVADGCACLTVPTRFLKSWIEAHYLDRVLPPTGRRRRRCRASASACAAPAARPAAARPRARERAATGAPRRRRSRRGRPSRPGPRRSRGGEAAEPQAPRSTSA